MAQVLGLIKLFWGGQQLPIKPGGSVKIGGLVNKEVIFGQEVGRSQSFQASEVDAKMVVKRGMVLMDMLGSSLEQELQVECDTGQIFVWDSAFRKDVMTVTSGDNSEVGLMFACGEATEIAA